MTIEFMCASHTISGAMPGSHPAARHTLEERLAACADAGYSGLWLHWRDYLDHRAAGVDDAALRRLLDRHGMRYRGVEFVTDWFLDTTDARASEAAAFAAARAIGAGIVNVGADFVGRCIPRRQMVARFEAFCVRAERAGLSIALEFVPWSDVPDIEAALEFMGPDNAGLVVDCWHVFRGGVPLEHVAALPAQRVLCVQVNDADATPTAPLPEDTARRKSCGEGAFDLTGFGAAVAAIGVRLPYSVEIISPEFASLPAAQAAQRSHADAAHAFGGNGERVRSSDARAAWRKDS